MACLAAAIRERYMVGVRTLYPENKSNPSIISVFLNVEFGTGFDSLFVENLCMYKNIKEY